MRKPARLAGLGELQAFLERGYDAFRAMGRSEEFVARVAARERALMRAWFAGENPRPERGGAVRFYGICSIQCIF